MVLLSPVFFAWLTNDYMGSETAWSDELNTQTHEIHAVYHTLL